MKKVIFMLMCCLVSLSTSAQRSSTAFSTEKTDATVTVGIRGGVNFSTLGNENFSSRAGFHAGFVVDVPLIQSLGIQSGLYYTVKGFEGHQQYYEYHDVDMISTVKTTLRYVEMPVLASYRYDFSDAVQLNVNVGPYIAYGIGGISKRTMQMYFPQIDKTLELADPDEKFFDYDYANRFDAGLCVGAGVMFCKHIYVGIAYEWGFTKVFERMKGYKNRNLTISTGYQF